MKIGEFITVDDGYLTLQVTEKDVVNKELVTKALNTHVVKSRRGERTGCCIKYAFHFRKRCEAILNLLLKWVLTCSSEFCKTRRRCKSCA